MRGDEADAEVLQDPAEVRWGLGPGQFFRQGPVRVIADEDTQAIAVQGQREPGRRTEVLGSGFAGGVAWLEQIWNNFSRAG